MSDMSGGFASGQKDIPACLVVISNVLLCPVFPSSLLLSLHPQRVIVSGKRGPLETSLPSAGCVASLRPSPPMLHS